MANKSDKSDSTSTVHGSNQTSDIGDRQHRNWHNLDNRLSMIAEAAYFKAEKRSFIPGFEEADWLKAEQELAKIMGEA